MLNPNPNNTIPDIARRDVFDTLRLHGYHWAGVLEEHIFLGRVFDLPNLPSKDPRYTTADKDIWKHRVINTDWPEDWLISDNRFRILSCEDALFLRFICEIIHPFVHPSPDTASKICDLYNKILIPLGYKVIVKNVISGHSIYGWTRDIAPQNIPLNCAKETLHETPMDYVNKQLIRLSDAMEDDPDLAIGTAKEFVETICKTILEERKIIFDHNEIITKLVRQVAEALTLTPEGVRDEVKAAKSIKGILKSLSTIAQGMMEIRNAYGTGHGKAAGHKGLTIRHAKLTVGAATTLAVFLWETHTSKQT